MRSHRLMWLFVALVLVFYSNAAPASDPASAVASAKRPEPFFLALGIFKPHSPYKVPKRYWNMYRREDIPDIHPADRPRNAPELAFHANHKLVGEPSARRRLDEDAKREIRHGYYAAMSYADAQFGRVLDTLDELKIRDNTIVVIIGDNGFEL